MSARKDTVAKVGEDRKDQSEKQDQNVSDHKKKATDRSSDSVEPIAIPKQVVNDRAAPSEEAEKKDSKEAEKRQETEKPEVKPAQKTRPSSEEKPQI